MSHLGHGRSPEALLAAHRRATSPVDPDALLRAIVSRIVHEEVAEDDEDVVSASDPPPQRRRRLVPAVVAVGVALAAGLVLVLSLEGRSMHAEEDARRFQSSDGQVNDPLRAVWLHEADPVTAEPEGTQAAPADPITPPHRALPYAAPPESDPGEPTAARREPRPRAPAPDPRDASAARSVPGPTAWPTWPGDDDRDPSSPTTGGMGGGWPTGGSGGTPKTKDGDTSGEHGGGRAKRPKSAPRPRPSGVDPDGDAGPPPPQPPPPAPSDPPPVPGCIEEHEACLNAGVEIGQCEEIFANCQLGLQCESEWAACEAGGAPPGACEAQLEACLDPGEPPPSCIGLYDACIGATGDAEACGIELEACLGEAPDACPEPGACGNFDPVTACFEEYDTCMGGPMGTEDPMQDQLCADVLDACLQQVEPAPEPMPEDPCFATWDECMMLMPEDPSICDGDLDECLADLG